jgi:hypothetical protein
VTGRPLIVLGMVTAPPEPRYLELVPKELIFRHRLDGLNGIGTG